MNAVVVYESYWGNTAQIAQAVARGLGEGATALTTTAATPEALRDVDLVVIGAPLLGFALPTEQMRSSLAGNPSTPPSDTSNPTVRTWLENLDVAPRAFATFETRIWWSPGSAASTVAKMLAKRGWQQVGKPERFMVTGRFGPLKPGESQRAEVWGGALAMIATAGGAARMDDPIAASADTTSGEGLAE